MEQKPTIKTIAQIAGVSHVAVSRALRGCSDISAATTARILQIARDIGYTPNAAARSLSSKRSNSVGMIVPAMGENTAYNVVFNEISSAAAAQGFCVMLGSSHRSMELEEKHCRMMVENRVGALIISPCTSDVSHIKKICNNIVPVIFIGGKTSPGETYSIFCNYRYSATLAVNHLFELGHRDISLFIYEPDNLTIRQKEEGFREEMQKRRLVPKIYKYGHSSDTFKAGKELSQLLIENHELPSAIWCASDLMAIGVLNTLEEYGILVPEDVSVIGHDDMYFGIFPGIMLTTLHTPMADIGKNAAELAISLAKKEEKTAEIQRTLHTSLVVRKTTGPCPAPGRP